MKTIPMRLIIVAGLAGALASAVGCGGSSGGTPTDAGGGSGGSAGHVGGSGGSGGTGGAISHVVSYTFATGLEGFILNDYCEPNPTVNFNLDGRCTTDGGTDAADAGDGGTAATPPTLTFEAADGMPAGSLKVTAVYTDYNQYSDAIINLTAPVDLTNKTLHAVVKLVSSTPTGFPGGPQLHASAGNTYMYSQDGILTLGSFTPVSVPISMAAWTTLTVPAMVQQIGLQVYSGGPPATGPRATFPFTVVYEVDNITD